MMRVMALVTAIAMAAGIAGAAEQEWTVERVPYDRVEVREGFWKQRLETNREHSIPHVLQLCEETGRIRNFARAAGLDDSEREGAVYNDSDVYKLMEGMAYALEGHTGNVMRSRLEQVTSLVDRAQQPDGYLNTYYTLRAPDERWTNLAADHELYCAGHLAEAAIAHYERTGKEHFLDIARKFTQLIDKRFGPDARHGVPGHEEIELALVRLWKVTGEERYLDLARFFVRQRGNDDERELFGEYAQDHKPLVQQKEAVGHCVRALYLYAAATELAAVGDRDYREAMQRLWKNVVHRKMYVTGGVGVHGYGEGFSEAYHLPNQQAYSETCASIGMAFWNDRMFRLLGAARYADVFERVLYNGLLAGVSLEGETFFYTNPLASNGGKERQPWFGTACCPTNVVRFMPRIGGYAYVTGENGSRLTVVHYMDSATTCELGDEEVHLSQETRYPWDGDVKLTVSPSGPAEFTLRLRIPDWARGELSSTNLYSYVDPGMPPVTLRINGQEQDVEGLQDGFLELHRTWEEGDTVELHLPMPVKKVKAHPEVEADRGRVAIMRGPVVYCLEETDHSGDVKRIAVPEDADMTPSHRPELLGGVTVLQGSGRQAHLTENANGELEWSDRKVQVTAVPYFAWANREPGAMRVWLPTDLQALDLPEDPGITALATPAASHCHDNDTVTALNDGVIPGSSGDESVPRMTWWPRRGDTEWVQYTFEEPRAFSGADVYWFDDRGRGQCRVPKSWRLLYLDDGTWQPVEAKDAYRTSRDEFNAVSFEPVTTRAVRLEVELQDGYSGGVLEWRLQMQ